MRYFEKVANPFGYRSISKAYDEGMTRVLDHPYLIGIGGGAVSGGIGGALIGGATGAEDGVATGALTGAALGAVGGAGVGRIFHAKGKATKENYIKFLDAVIKDPDVSHATRTGAEIERTEAKSFGPGRILRKMMDEK